MAEWHVPPQGRFDGTQNEREFREQGPLVSIGREPPQNSTDNPLPGSTSPVLLRISKRTLPSSPELLGYFPDKWIGHVTAPDNSRLVSYTTDYRTDSLKDLLEDQVEVLLVEDYNATGLVGDVTQMQPKRNGSRGYDKATEENTFFWFLRATGATRVTVTRGGSWGLGKLAFPIASSIRTFFVVTSRESSADRYLAGQTVLDNHMRFSQWYQPMMYYAQDDLQEGRAYNAHDWLPISDEGEIDSFCSVFGVDRPLEKSGTSVVVPLPRRGLNLEDIAICMVSNYCVPILSGQLALQFVDEDETLWDVNSENIRELIDEGCLSWGRQGRHLPGARVVNPAWTTKGRMKELIRLYDSLESASPDKVELPLGTPNASQRPNSNEQWDSILPERDSEELAAAKVAFNDHRPVHIRGSLPVRRRSGGMETGRYELILRKCEDGEDAESHFYRDQISLPLVNEKEPASAGVSSLLIVRGEGNPLRDMLRDAEGPAHLLWSKQAERLRDYHYGSTTIDFLKQVASKVINRITSVQTEAVSVWDDIFSLGKPVRPIVRHFTITEHEGGGFSMTAREDAPDLTGRQYVARVGYPGPASASPAKPPDERSIDVHAMDWEATGARIDYDVQAKNGEVCVDRVRITIEEQDFTVELSGLMRSLKAQVIVAPEVIG